jgi:hypothetical protein
MITLLTKMKNSWLEKLFEKACHDCDYEMQEGILSLESSSTSYLEQMRTCILGDHQKK